MRAGEGRQQLVWRLLADALGQVSTPSRPVRALDCGGGSGSFAVPLARAGAHVTVVDVSADALATLGRRAAEAGVGARVSGVQGEIESLPLAVADGRFDLVLAHEILEAVDDLPAAIGAAAAATRPAGLVSVLLINPVAGVLGRAMAGDLPAARSQLAELGEARTEQRVVALAQAAGLQVRSRHGVGVFAEFVPGEALDHPGTRDLLLELDDAAATRSPFVDIAPRIHLLLGRPAAET